uniref:Auxin-responsive protein n=1 Tax=Hordeum vulgare subsp. vulgare TaxID=112509 RepID=A0A8I6XY95_HORVV
MAAWLRKETSEAYYLTADAGGDGGKKVPKGYLPLALVGEEGDGDERVLVCIGALKDPCMAALLDMAAEQFGYGQPGVLRIPCNAQQFHRMVTAMCSKSKIQPDSIR